MVALLFQLRRASFEVAVLPRVPQMLLGTGQAQRRDQPLNSMQRARAEANAVVVAGVSVAAEAQHFAVASAAAAG